VAIADGASTSACQQEWADILTSRFVAQPFDLSLDEPRDAWRQASLKEWVERVGSRPDHWRANYTDYWMTLRLYREVGALATFLGFFVVQPEFEDSRPYYRLFSVGDCAGFWFAEGKFVRMEPHIDAFSTTPALLSTKRAFPMQHLHSFGNTPIPGDLLVLATDALADYLSTFRPWEHDANFWQTWWGGTDDSFAAWTNSLKGERLIKPDDYTMVLVLLSDGIPAMTMAPAQASSPE